MNPLMRGFKSQYFSRAGIQSIFNHFEVFIRHRRQMALFRNVLPSQTIVVFIYDRKILNWLLKALLLN